MAGILQKTTINLVPEDIRRGWHARRVRAALVTVAVAYLLGLGALYMAERANISSLHQSIDTLSAEKAALAARSAEYRELTVRLAETRRGEAEAKRRLETATKLTEGIVSWSAVLRRLSNDIPTGVWLRTLSTADLERTEPVAQGTGAAGKRVRFLGTALSNTAVADFIFTLENSGYFTAVDLSYTQKREVLSSIVYDFEVAAALKLTPDIMYEW